MITPEQRIETLESVVITQQDAINNLLKWFKQYIVPEYDFTAHTEPEDEKLTAKQCEAIIELYKNLHITDGGVFCTKEDAFMLFKNALTANTEPEDETDMVYCPYCKREWDCNIELECGCNMEQLTDNQITLRKIDEYSEGRELSMVQTSVLASFSYWLQREDK